MSRTTSATFTGSLVTTATSSSNVGGYPITQGTLAATGNYTINTFNPSTLTVTPAPLTVTATNESMTYGGTVPTPLTYTYTGLVNSDSSATFTGSLVTTATSSSNVGGYPITQGTLAATGNYTISTYDPGTLTVNAAPLTITANNDSKTYGTLKTFSSRAFTETGLVNGDTITGVTETSTGAPASEPIGSYPIILSTATGTGLSNYTITYINGTLTVNPATLTITSTSESKVYEMTATLTYTTAGLVNGNKITSVTETSAGAVKTANVGSYPIDISNAVGTGLSNYNINYVDGTLTVTPATANVVVTPYDVTYNSQPHTVSGKATGVNGVTLPASDLNLTGTTHTNAGTYTDTWTFTDPNYVSQSGKATDIITSPAKANATIHVTGYDVTYNGLAHSATGMATGVGGVNLASYLTIHSTHTNAGVYTDTWTFSDPNYISQSGKVTDIINKANAYIIVSPYNVAFNGCAHIATGIAIGVNGQALPGLNLGGTVHLGGYNTTILYDRWTFTDTTGNYNSTSGVVVDVIRGNQALYRAMYHPFYPRSVFYGRLFMW